MAVRFRHFSVIVFWGVAYSTQVLSDAGPSRTPAEPAQPYIARVQALASTTGELTREQVSGIVFHDLNRNGQQDSGEPGVAGVAVSNGFEVTSTDADGRYRLPAKAAGLEAFTVFITKPAGYDVPVDADNVPQFFYNHKPSGSPPLRFGGLPPTGAQPEAINFPLVAGDNARTFKIAVSGDPQPYSNNEVGYVRDALANELSLRDDLAFVMIEGDIMGDDLGLYPRFKNIMKAAGIPQYYVPGNHDLDIDATDDTHSFDTFKREWGPTYYSFDMGLVHFVVLDNVRYPCTPEDNRDGRHPMCTDPANSPAYNGVIDDAQLQWLANDLALVSPEKLIVLNMHMPLVSYITMGNTQQQTDNAKALYELIGDRPALALSGHTHTLENFRPGESYLGWQESLGIKSVPFPHIVTGATSGSWWSGDFSEYNLPMSIQRLGAPRGYLILTFNGPFYSSAYKAANKGAEEQMSLDFLSPSFLVWYQAMKAWSEKPEKKRTPEPPVSINDLPDTRILTNADLAVGSQLMINVWNGSRDSAVWVQIDDRKAGLAVRTQTGTGEDKIIALDPFALKKQMYIFRYAAASTSGDARAQGFELFNGAHFGTSDPRPAEGWFWTENSSHLWSYPVPKDLSPGVHVARVVTRDVHGKVDKANITFEVRTERPEPYFRKALFEKP